MNTWLEFWNSPHSIYVCDEHKIAHYHQIASDTLEVIPPTAKTILDWGCGEALGTELLVSRGLSVLLFDKASSCQAELAKRFQDTGGVEVLTQESITGIRAGSLDVVMINSVVQYFSKAEFGELQQTFHQMLRPDGLLIVSDVIPPSSSLLADVWALLRLGFLKRFMPQAVSGLFRTFWSPYRSLRRKVGLTTYSEAEIRGMLSTSGFQPKKAAKNIGCNPYRVTYLGQKL